MNRKYPLWERIADVLLAVAIGLTGFYLCATELIK